MNEQEVPARRQEDSWHLDKRVPIAIIITFLLTVTTQSIIFAYGYGVLNEKVERQQVDISRMSDVMPRLVRMETLMEGVLVTLQDISNYMRTTKEKDK